MSSAEKLESDLLLLAGSLLAPERHELLQPGFMRSRPLHRGYRGFRELNRLCEPRRFLNAYNIDSEQIEPGRGGRILTFDIFGGAFVSPFRYAP